MKVKELLNKAHLLAGQKTTLEDHSTATKYVSIDRYCFGLTHKETVRLLNLKVNGFFVSDDGLKIWAE